MNQFEFYKILRRKIKSDKNGEKIEQKCYASIEGVCVGGGGCLCVRERESVCLTGFIQLISIWIWGQHKTRGDRKRGTSCTS
jgi:hypothetical protein